MAEKLESYFDGGLGGLIGNGILAFLITFFTLSICYPWALCIIEKWHTRHTIIGGRRLQFDGSAIGLFGTWIKIILLSIITFGIYGFWAGLAIKKWKIKYTVFAEEE